jgi:hypothetical protein
VVSQLSRVEDVWPDGVKNARDTFESFNELLWLEEAKDRCVSCKDARSRAVIAVSAEIDPFST